MRVNLVLFWHCIANDLFDNAAFWVFSLQDSVNFIFNKKLRNLYNRFRNF